MNDEKLLVKEEYIISFIKSFVELEEAMGPFKEQKRELRDEYHENNWLSKQEMRLAVKAYRLLQQDTDLEQLVEYFDKFSKKIGVIHHA